MLSIRPSAFFRIIVRLVHHTETRGKCFLFSVLSFCILFCLFFTLSGPHIHCICCFSWKRIVIMSCCIGIGRGWEETDRDNVLLHSDRQRMGGNGQAGLCHVPVDYLGVVQVSVVRSILPFTNTDLQLIQEQHPRCKCSTIYTRWAHHYSIYFI